MWKAKLFFLWLLYAHVLPSPQHPHALLDAGLWPLPFHLEVGTSSCWLGPEVDVIWKGEASQRGLGPHVIQNFKHRLSDPTKGFTKWTESISHVRSFSTLRIESTGVVEQLTLNTSEAYMLTIPQCHSDCSDLDEATSCPASSKSEIVIAAETALGIARAVETLLQLMSTVDGQHTTAASFVISGVPWHIQDHPRFPHRGLLLDTSRNFLPLRSLLQTIDAMAQSKMSVLHWHIVDAPSFPFHSSSAPFLSQHGAYSPEQTYSPADVAHVVAHAFKRGVRVLPEFDMPGHAYAWGLGQPTLTVCSGMQPWEQYCAEPPCGQLDPTLNSTYDIISALLADVHSVFTDAFLHLGADEVNYACWGSDAGLVQRMRAQGVQSLPRLWEAFEERLLATVKRNGRRVILWQDAWEAGLRLPNDTILQVWKGLHDVGRAAAEGFDVVVSNADAWYLDCGAGSFVDGGRSWCDPFKTWEAMLDNDVLEHVEPEHQHHVLGGEVCMWTEQVDQSNLHSKVWPRAAAAAEALWNPSGRYDMGGAKRRLAQHRLRLVSSGVGAAPIHPQWCTRRPGECDSHAPAQHASSHGVIEFPSAAVEDEGAWSS